jgi:DNA-binding transcriptional ArsR family regulator
VKASLRHFVSLTKALGSGPRLRILMALRDQELCESVLTELLGLAASTVSRHLRVLETTGLVDSEKTGRCVCYRRALANDRSPIGQTWCWLESCLTANSRVKEDAARLKLLVERSPVEALCRRQRHRACC